MVDASIQVNEFGKLRNFLLLSRGNLKVRKQQNNCD